MGSIGWVVSQHPQPIVKPMRRHCGWGGKRLLRQMQYSSSLSLHTVTKQSGFLLTLLVFQTQMCLITYKYHSLTAPKNNN